MIANRLVSATNTSLPTKPAESANPCCAPAVVTNAPPPWQHTSAADGAPRLDSARNASSAPAPPLGMYASLPITPGSLQHGTSRTVSTLHVPPAYLEHTPQPMVHSGHSLSAAQSFGLDDGGLTSSWDSGNSSAADDLSVQPFVRSGSVSPLSDFGVSNFLAHLPPSFQTSA
ncbi:hypothetical protein EON62_03055 [archaeon]|nr:MAG: hypothetical protein EON62_03055 [archaeon]